MQIRRPMLQIEWRRNVVDLATARDWDSRKISIGRENAVGDARISFEANDVADIMVVELDEIRRRPAPAWQICRTDEGFRCDERACKRTEIFITYADNLQRTAIVGGDVRCEFSLVIVREQMKGETGFLEVVHAFNASGAGLGLAEDGQQQGGENSNDRNDDKHFDQSERSFFATGLRHDHACRNF